MHKKGMRIRIDAFVNIFIIIILNIIIGAVDYSGNIDRFYVVLASFSVLITVMVILFEQKMQGQLLNFSNVFLALCFVFTFGQVILKAIFSYTGTTGYTIVIDYYGESETIYALKIILGVFSSICLGYLFAERRSKRISHQTMSDFSPESQKFVLREKRYAKTIIILTLPVRVITDLLILVAGLSAGLAGSVAITKRIPDIAISYGNFSIIGLAVLIYSLRNEKLKQTRVFIGIALYFFIMMLNGRRSETVAYLCVITLVYLSTRGKLKIVKLGRYILIGYLFLAALYSVVLMRVQFNSYSISAYLVCLGQSLTSRNIIFETLREYGNTCYTPITVLVKWLPNHSPSWGTSYYLGISAAFINILGIPGKMTLQSNYGLALQETTGILSTYYTNIGGSAIGEWLFNFGKIGALIVAFLVGVLIVNISKRVNERILSKDISTIAYLIPLMTSLLYWIRDYFSGGIREAIWGVLFVYVTRRFLMKYNK